jgi:hypothetical protein
VLPGGVCLSVPQTASTPENVIMFLIVGLAVRMGHDLGLHLDPTSIDDGEGEGKEKGEYSAEELWMRRKVWDVTLILDTSSSLANSVGHPPSLKDIFLQTVIPPLPHHLH